MLKLIGTQQQWNNHIDSLPKTFLKVAGRPDLVDKQLLIIAAGNKPSSGYTLRLNNTAASLVNHVLTIDVELTVPKEISSAVITSPCLMVLVDTSAVSQINAAGMTWRRE